MDFIKKSKLSILFILILVVSGCAPQFGQIADSEKLRVDKSQVFDFKEEGGRVVYFYKTGNIIEPQKLTVGREVKDEIMERRLPNARFYPNGENRYIVEVLNSHRMMKTNKGDWEEYNWATTTKKAFDQEMKSSLIERMFGAPVYAISTTTYNPNDPASDGRIGSNHTTSAGVDWSVLVGGNNLDQRSDYFAENNIYVRSNSNSEKWTTLMRSYATFNTSFLGDVTINSAVVSLYGSAKADNTLGASMEAAVVKFSPASSTAPTTSDWSNYGATAISNQISYADWSTSGYNDYTLTDLSVINKSGYSTFGFREMNYDAATTSPTWSSAKTQRTEFYTNEHETLNQTPKVTIDYTEGGASVHIDGFKSYINIIE